jgi:hypothetical protein
MLLVVLVMLVALVALVVMPVTTCIVFVMLPVIPMAIPVATAIVLAMLPVAPVVVPVAMSIVPVIVPGTVIMIATIALVYVVLRVMLSMVAGRPPWGMPVTVLVFQEVVIFAAARITRVRVISLDGGNASQYQACGEQEGLKQCAGFHESDSFLVCLMRQ